MVEVLKITNGSKYDMQGLSTDPKPTEGLSADSSFLELDTKSVWTYSVLNTNPATSNGWWEL